MAIKLVIIFAANFDWGTADVFAVVFLERLQSYAALPSSHILHLSSLYHFSKSSNAEIRLRFYEVALIDPLTPAAKLFASEAAKWVVGEDGTGVVKGRMKFCRPIFRYVRIPLGNSRLINDRVPDPFLRLIKS
jgi:hypothetical protein